MTITQDINLILSAVASILVVLWTIEDKERWRYATAILLVLIHMLIFYLMFFLNSLGLFVKPLNNFFSLWSSYVRTHLLISTIVSFCILIEWKKLWKRLKRT